MSKYAKKWFSKEEEAKTFATKNNGQIYDADFIGGFDVIYPTEINLKGKDIRLEIDTKDHVGFRLQLVADDYAFYVNPGDDVLVSDLRANEILGEDVGLKRYYETMDSIVNNGMLYDYGDTFILLNGKHFVKSEKSISDLDKKLQITDVVKQNIERKKLECGLDKITQHKTAKSGHFGRE